MKKNFQQQIKYNLKILNEINIEFLEYDKLNNMKKFQTHLNSFQDFLPNNSNL